MRTHAGWAHDVVSDTIEAFQLKRIRAGIETLLAASGVSREVRGHLQSHGLTGVQARHYDGNDYMPKKRQAIEILVREVCQCVGRCLMRWGCTRRSRLFGLAHASGERE